MGNSTKKERGGLVEKVEYNTYISLGGMCYTPLLIPHKNHNLPFDSIDRGDLGKVYDILKEIKNNTFDARKFAGQELDENSINVENGWRFVHYNPPKSNENRQDIFERKFNRLKNILNNNQNKIFLYYNNTGSLKKDKIGNFLDILAIKNIHDLFPEIKFLYFDQKGNIPLIKEDCLKTFHLNIYDNIDLDKSMLERFSILKTAIGSGVFSEKEIKVLEYRAERVQKEKDWTKIIWQSELKFLEEENQNLKEENKILKKKLNELNCFI
jgi:hypothetical protein